MKYPIEIDAGFHAFTCEATGEEYGSFEVFWLDRDWDGEGGEEGWYFAAGFPGCLWDSDPVGPFTSSREARDEADPFHTLQRLPAYA